MTFGWRSVKIKLLFRKDYAFVVTEYAERSEGFSGKVRRSPRERERGQRLSVRQHVSRRRWAEDGPRSGRSDGRSSRGRCRGPDGLHGVSGPVAEWSTGRSLSDEMGTGLTLSRGSGPEQGGCAVCR